MEFAVFPKNLMDGMAENLIVAWKEWVGGAADHLSPV